MRLLKNYATAPVLLSPRSLTTARSPPAPQSSPPLRSVRQPSPHLACCVRLQASAFPLLPLRAPPALSLLPMPPFPFHLLPCCMRLQVCLNTPLFSLVVCKLQVCSTCDASLVVKGGHSIWLDPRRQALIQAAAPRVVCTSRMAPRWGEARAKQA